jgi:hypothetical protein
MPNHRTLMLDTSAGGATSPDATTGELYTLPIQQNGQPGALHKIWESGPKEAPDGFALARSGNVYMALVGPDTNQLVAISPSGAELARFPSDNSGNNGSSVPFDEPSSVQFDGKRLIVTNDSYFSGDPSHFAIFDVFAAEPGAPVYVPGDHPYKLTVKPSGIAAGALRTLRFHATHGSRLVRGALVKLAGRSALTDRSGNAQIVVRFQKPGRRMATLRIGKQAQRSTVAKAFVSVFAPPVESEGR